MKLIAVAIGATILSGCAVMYPSYAAKWSNEDVIKFTSKYQPSCDNNEALYEAAFNEMRTRENAGKMNRATDDVAVVNAALVCVSKKSK